MLFPFSCPALLHSHTSWPCAKGLRNQARLSVSCVAPAHHDHGPSTLEGITMLRGMVRMDLNRRLNANRALSATMSFLALIGWGAFAYSAGTSARAERQLRDELALSKAAQDRLMTEHG